MTKLVTNAGKEYKDKIKTIQIELNNANKDLEETEKEYKQSNLHNEAFELNIKTSKQRRKF